MTDMLIVFLSSQYIVILIFYTGSCLLACRIHSSHAPTHFSVLAICDSEARTISQHNLFILIVHDLASKEKDKGNC